MGIHDLKRAYVAGAFDGMADSAEDLLGRAQRDAPVDEGTLRASGTIVYIINGGRYEGPGARTAAREAAVAGAAHGGVEMDAEVSFNTVYSAAQHEQLAFMVRDGTPIVWQVKDPSKHRHWKYLERNLVEMAPRYDAVIGASAERRLDLAT